MSRNANQSSNALKPQGTIPQNTKSKNKEKKAANNEGCSCLIMWIDNSSFKDFNN